MPKTEAQLLKRDAERNIAEELLQSVKEMAAGKSGTIHNISQSEIVAARLSTGMSQDKFADIMGVSVKTLRSWEQGIRNPSGAARTLIKIAQQHPRILKKVAG